MKVMPAFTVVFLIVTLSSVALPLTSGFTGEILMLMGSFQTQPIATGFATTSAIWSVVYMLWMFQRVMHGSITHPENEKLPDWTSGEKWALVPLVVLIFVLGIGAAPTLKIVNSSANAVIDGTHAFYTPPSKEADGDRDPHCSRSPKSITDRFVRSDREQVTYYAFFAAANDAYVFVDRFDDHHAIALGRDRCDGCADGRSWPATRP